MIQWLVENWLIVSAPILVFLAIFIIGLWLRRSLYRYFDRWTARTKWEGAKVITETMHRPFCYWSALFGIAIASQVSVLPLAAKSLTGKVLSSLFILSLGWVLIVLSEWFIRQYVPRLKTTQLATGAVINLARIIVTILATLTLLDVWGVPTAPLLLLMVAIILAAALVFRDTAPNLFAGFQLSATGQIKVGDYLKLETGEEGYVTEVKWNNTIMKGLDQSSILVPNGRLLRNTVVNYGHPLKTARSPFRFFSRIHLKELTGLKARNLPEMVNILKKVPDAVTYYHTHHFLEEHHFLTPEPSNDFALWVSDALGDEVLAEKLASVDTFSFSTLASLRDRLVGILEEHIASGRDLRSAMEGEEFYFVKSVGVILPTPYLAYDLREFIEALRRVSVSSLYFHIFESRLRLGQGLNDFSAWLGNSLDEPELADEIARADPYTYSLEGLRSWLLQIIEKRIK